MQNLIGIHSVTSMGPGTPSPLISSKTHAYPQVSCTHELALSCVPTFTLLCTVTVLSVHDLAIPSPWTQGWLCICTKLYIRRGLCLFTPLCIFDPLMGVHSSLNSTFFLHTQDLEGSHHFMIITPLMSCSHDLRHFLCTQCLVYSHNCTDPLSCKLRHLHIPSVLDNPKSEQPHLPGELYNTLMCP